MTVAIIMLLLSVSISASAQRHGADTLSGKTEVIKESVVTATTLLRRHGDRITYDVSKDPDANKLDMAEMMEKIPELRMSSRDGRLEFQGQKVGTILVDDDHNGIINSGRQYPMRFIKASYMKEIELVLPGSIEYNNDQPMIRITLSRKLPYGFAGQLSAEADIRNSYSPAVDMVVNAPYIGLGIGYDYDYSGPPARSTVTQREYTDPESALLSSESTRKTGSSSQNHNIRFNVFRSFFNESVKFNSTIRTSYSAGKGFSEASSEFYGKDGSLTRSSYTKTTDANRSPFRFNAAMSLRGGFGPVMNPRTGMRKHVWEAKYAFINGDEESSALRESDTYPLRRHNSSDWKREHRLDMNIQMRDIMPKPFSGGLIVRAGFYGRHYGQEAHYYNDDSGVMTEDWDLFNGLDYRQNVVFGEVDALGSFLDRKYGYIVTLKGEYVGNKGTFLAGTVSSPLSYRQFNLIPKVSFSRAFKRGFVDVGYSMVVHRPDVAKLNPYVDDSDPDNNRTGNPGLKGDKTHTVSMGVNYQPVVKWVRDIGGSVSYSHDGNSLQRLTSVSSEGVSTTSYANVGGINSVGLNSHINFSAAKRLSIGVTGGVSRSWGKLPSGGNNSWWSPRVTMHAGGEIKGFDVHAGLLLMPTLASAQSRKMVLNPRLEVSVSRFFPKPKLGVSLSATDILHGSKAARSVIGDVGFVQTTLAERLGRNFSLRIYWQFGRFRNTDSVNVDAYDM